MDYSEMTGPQLVEAYNEMAVRKGVPTVQKFESKAVGVKRCEDLAKRDDFPEVPDFLRRTEEPKPAVDHAPAEHPKRSPEEQEVQREADRRWRTWMPTREQTKRPRRASIAKQVRKERKLAAREAIKAAAREGKPSLKRASRSRRADRVIRIKRDSNPYKPDKKAHQYFEAMVSGPTVGEYLAKFPQDYKTASQWLWNMCRDGHVELLG